MHNQRVIIIGSNAAELYAVRHAIEDSGGILVIEGRIADLHEDTRLLESIDNESEPIYFKNYNYYDDIDLKLELDDKPMCFNRKQVSNYPKPIFKPSFVRRGNRGK